jgi:hypothetical protein
MGGLRKFLPNVQGGKAQRIPPSQLAVRSASA